MWLRWRSRRVWLTKPPCNSNILSSFFSAGILECRSCNFGVSMRIFLPDRCKVQWSFSFSFQMVFGFINSSTMVTFSTDVYGSLLFDHIHGSRTFYIRLSSGIRKVGLLCWTTFFIPRFHNKDLLILDTTSGLWKLLPKSSMHMT